MSKEYIEREALIAEIEENINTYWNEGSGGYYLAEDALNHSVKTAPTADVEPVVHAEWIPIVSYFHGKPDGRYCCSACHRVETMKGIYCRLCGALMDGGKIK